MDHLFFNVALEGGASKAGLPAFIKESQDQRSLSPSLAARGQAANCRAGTITLASYCIAAAAEPETGAGGFENVPVELRRQAPSECHPAPSISAMVTVMLLAPVCQ